jgi:hypothetical protein
MTAATAPRATVNAPRLLLLALVIAIAFGAAFAIGKATAGDSAESNGGGAQPLQLPDAQPRAPSIAAPAALPDLKDPPKPAGGTAPAPGGGSRSAPAPAPTPAPAPAPAPAPPSGGGGGGGGGGGPIIEG